MTKKLDKEITIDTYNRTSKVHSTKFKKYGSRTADIEKAFSYVDKPNPRVLELGCGDGRDTKEILKRTNDYLGIDLSKELIKIAKKETSKAKFVLADFEKLNFTSGIDIVFAFAALLHSDKKSVRDILVKVAKSLNKSGIFFISSKYGDYARKIIDRGGPKVNYLYTPSLMKELAPISLMVIHKNIQKIRGQKWFEMIFQKI